MYGCCSFIIFFFKQKTAYEMRIRDWSSDVCSSDLFGPNLENIRQAFGGRVLVLPEVDEGNCVVLALKGPVLAVSVRRFLDRADAVESAYGLPARQWARALLAHHAVAEVFGA